MWGFSALPESPSLSDSEAERFDLTLTPDDELIEAVRDWRRRCEVPDGLLGVSSAAASLGVLMLLVMRLLMCLRPSRD